MSFKDIIGQEKAVSIILRTLQRGRIPTSYLFAGESGTGKKLTAINLAKALNCLTPQNQTLNDLPPFFKGGAGGITESLVINACDECSSCKKIDHGVHPDLLLISPESGQIRIEEIRSVDEALSLKPFEGKYKIVIVDDADTMNQYAANAFLKTLEEPPANSLLVLISSNPDGLPDTIRSRCSRINFTPLSQDACRKVIEKVMGQQISAGRKKASRSESLQVEKLKDRLNDESLLLTLVRLSMGRPGSAVSGDLLEEREWFMKLLKEMLNAEKDGWASREEMEKWFDLLLILLRDMAVVKITRDDSAIINIDKKEYLNKLSSPMDLKVIIENYRILSKLKGYFNFNVNKSLAWNYTGSFLRARMDMTNA